MLRRLVPSGPGTWLGSPASIAGYYANYQKAPPGSAHYRPGRFISRHTAIIGHHRLRFTYRGAYGKGSSSGFIYLTARQCLGPCTVGIL